MPSFPKPPAHGTDELPWYGPSFGEEPEAGVRSPNQSSFAWLFLDAVLVVGVLIIRPCYLGSIFWPLFFLETFILGFKNCWFSFFLGFGVRGMSCSNFL